MRLFEDSWSTKGKTFIREYDTNTQKSTKRETPYKSEYYLADPLGKYKGFLDGKPLRKVEGSAYNISDAYGDKAAKYVAISKEYFGKKQYNKTPRSWFLDIETKVGYNSTGFPNPEDAAEEICLIQLFDSQENKGYVLGLEDWYQRDDYKYDFKLDYVKFDTEKDLINGFINLFQILDPFLIYAWNGNGFDFPYIFNRMTNLKMKTNKLSNHGSVSLKERHQSNGMLSYSLTAAGHQWMDLQEIYKKFVYKNVSSYSLENIANIEAGIEKVRHDNYIKFDDFRTGKYVITGKETPEQKATKIHKCAEFIEANPEHEKVPRMKEYIRQKSYSEFVHYGVIDFVALKGIHDAQNFTMLMTNMADQMGCLIGDTLGTIRAWQVYINNVMAEQNLVSPPKRESDEKPNVVGGYVRDPIVGKSDWIISTDYASMYPMNMAAFNLSPEKRVLPENMHPDVKKISQIFDTQDEEKLMDMNEEQWAKIEKVAKEHNVSFNVGGGVFDITDQGLLPGLVVQIYQDRKKIKKEMWKQSNIVNDIKKELHSRGE